MSDQEKISNSAQPDDNSVKISLDKESVQLGEDKLMAYLDGKLSADEQHEIEKWLSEEGMESDAVEGLKMLAPSETKQTVSKLNADLRKKIGKKRKSKRQAKPEYTSLVAIVVIILLIVAAYFVIKMIT